MKATPILFSGAMVRALLEGRKTQTRRVVKHRFPYLWNEPYYATGKVLTGLENQPGAFMEFRYRKQDEPDYQGSPAAALVECPYGQSGDVLWVRETWSKAELSLSSELFYRADGELAASQSTFTYIERERRWRPSIHMPRWASRLALRITDVRVQRLLDISEEDSQAEGARASDAVVIFQDGTLQRELSNTNRGAFCCLWEAINGAGSWDANPWVWALTFEVEKINIDALLEKMTTSRIEAFNRTYDENARRRGQYEGGNS